MAQGVCFVADVPGGTARGAEAAAPQIRRLRRQKGRELAKAAQMLLDVSTKIVSSTRNIAIKKLFLYKKDAYINNCGVGLIIENKNPH